MIINVKTASGSYDITLKRNAINEVGNILDVKGKALIVTDSGVPEEYSKIVSSQIKNSVIPVGSINVDKDITYVFRSKMSESRKLKENFAMASIKYADNNDVWSIEIDKDNKKELNQLGVSKVVEARIREILKLSKNEIKT